MRVYFNFYKSGISATVFQLELGSSATDYAPYTPNNYTIDLNGARYGGTLDAVSGKLIVTHANIASYAGETINEPWLSSYD